MSSEHGRYVIVETIVGMAINVVLSGVFTWLFFHGRPTIAFAGAHGYGVDFFPQAFAIALMSVVVPTLLTRKRLNNEKIKRLDGADWFPAKLFVRAPLIAVTATLVLGGGLYVLGRDDLPQTATFSTLLSIKLVYGAVVALLVTPMALIAALRDPARLPAPSVRPGR